jgi:hypothetical protein
MAIAPIGLMGAADLIIALIPMFLSPLSHHQEIHF